MIEALDLSDIYGIGHSAGATDLLLAAKLLPARFSRLFVMEPTVMDPRAARTDGTGLSDFATAARAGRAAPPGRVRQSAKPSFARYRAAPAFADWTETSLRAYIRHGFAPQDDGRVRLRCTPEIESADAASDLRGDGAGLHRRRARQSVHMAVRDRLPGAHRHCCEILADLQGDGIARRCADSGREPMHASKASVTAWRRRRPYRLLAGPEKRSRANDSFNSTPYTLTKTSSPATHEPDCRE